MTATGFEPTTTYFVNEHSTIQRRCIDMMIRYRHLTIIFCDLINTYELIVWCFVKRSNINGSILSDVIVIRSLSSDPICWCFTKRSYLAVSFLNVILLDSLSCCFGNRMIHHVPLSYFEFTRYSQGFGEPREECGSLYENSFLLSK